MAGRQRKGLRDSLVACLLQVCAPAWMLLASGCAAPVVGPLKSYDGPVLGDDKVALLDWQSGGGHVLQIDDRPVDERARQAAVLPGRRTIQYLGTFGGSVLLGPAVRRVGPLIARLELQAGHVYLVKANRQGDWRSPSLYLWIEDAATGEVLHGGKPP